MVPMVPMMPSLDTAPQADEGDRARAAQLQSEASYRAAQLQSEASYRAAQLQSEASYRAAQLQSEAADDEEEARQMADAIRASLASAEAEAAADAARPLFDADTAPEEFLRSMQAEIATQTYAEAEAAFAARLEAEGLLTAAMVALTVAKAEEAYEEAEADDSQVLRVGEAGPPVSSAATKLEASSNERMEGMGATLEMRDAMAAQLQTSRAPPSPASPTATLADGAADGLDRAAARGADEANPDSPELYAISEDARSQVDPELSELYAISEDARSQVDPELSELYAISEDARSLLLNIIGRDGKDGNGKDGSGKDGSGKDGSGKDGSGKDGSKEGGRPADGRLARCQGRGSGQSPLSTAPPPGYAEAIAMLQELKPGVSEALCAHVLRQSAGDSGAAAELLFSSDEAELERQVQVELARETEERRQLAKADKDARRRAIERNDAVRDLAADCVELSAPRLPYAKSRKESLAAAKGPRYLDGQVVAHKGEKHIVVDNREEWDGGSRGRVKTKGKRGPGWTA
ncbi:hypothetical protein Ctob_000992 [Chrysochromulina tobinii]|uniref:CUE domain-containing protein n=1 Tax=Chrysochromulina tobinii TaxID=1460289 RepID=A0A0M0J684_9EUKA|nr:hypothetical protein Ctob_000992 [Chrysochromulina tobinii]|eukprot:KOO22111.1 hypothetical protein Ctob_000992 [Chrysochromulina sp. CCMP291]